MIQYRRPSNPFRSYPEEPCFKVLIALGQRPFALMWQLEIEWILISHGRFPLYVPVRFNAWILQSVNSRSAPRLL